jgi:hypothetical protein
MTALGWHARVLGSPRRREAFVSDELARTQEQAAIERFFADLFRAYMKPGDRIEVRRTDG